MSFHIRQCLMASLKYSMTATSLNLFRTSLNTKFVKSDRSSFVIWSSPVRRSSTLIQQSVKRDGELTLTESCIKRLKQICEEDNSYLRVMVRRIRKILNLTKLQNLFPYAKNLDGLLA